MMDGSKPEALLWDEHFDVIRLEGSGCAGFLHGPGVDQCSGNNYSALLGLRLQGEQIVKALFIVGRLKQFSCLTFSTKGAAVN